MKSQPTRTGLTLVELLVVIAVILMLAALLLPAVMRSRDSSRKVACANNLKQIANAVHQFHGRQGFLPSYWGSMSRQGGHYGGWFLHMLPDMDKQTLYDSLSPPATVPRCNPTRIITAVIISNTAKR
jgi:prepilin-type N-terminal cleavage/methylation domain-containing protein